MAQLDQLPVEILSEICSHLCTHCLEPETAWFKPHFHSKDRQEIRRRRHALVMLCRTSTSLRSIAQPYVYHFLYQWSDSDFELSRIAEILTSQYYPFSSSNT
jgi:hypothetical protein